MNATTTIIILAVAAAAIYAIGRRDAGHKTRRCRHCGHANGEHRVDTLTYDNPGHSDDGFCYGCLDCREQRTAGPVIR